MVSGSRKRDCLCTREDVRRYGCVERLSRQAAEGIVNISFHLYISIAYAFIHYFAKSL